MNENAKRHVRYAELKLDQAICELKNAKAHMTGEDKDKRDIEEAEQLANQAACKLWLMD